MRNKGGIHRVLWALSWMYVLSSCGMFSSGSYKKVSCDFDFSIGEEDKTLDLSEYELGKSYENDSSTVKVLLINEETNERTKYVYMKNTGIKKIISYDSIGRISDVYFKYSEADVGPQYDFDEYGNITDSIDTDSGYTICWAQAMAIGKSYAKHKMHKTEPDLILTKPDRDTDLIRWHFFYTNKKDKRKMLFIDGQTGKILKEYKVIIE